jgi:hypothetical protein
MNRKGQIASELMSTYGWSALMIMMVVGTMAYYISDDPGKFAPDSCYIEAGKYCTDFKIAKEGIVIQITSADPIPWILKEIEFTDEKGIIENCKATITEDNYFSSSDRYTYTIGNVDGEQGIGICNIKEGYSGKIKADVIITYENTNSGFEHKTKGYMIAEVR